MIATEPTPPAATRIAAMRASPLLFLTVVYFLNWMGFSFWQALLNNFAKEQAGFTGAEIGLLQSIREIPGFLAFTAVFLFLFLREQTLAYLGLLTLGFGVAIAGSYPTVAGLLITTFIMSVGFHYLETANQALQLQLLPKAEAPKLLGRIAGWGGVAQIIAYATIWIAWDYWRPSYETLYVASGATTAILAIAAALFFKRFNGPTPQRKGFVLRKRYGLYYALTFMAGARKQIFMAFGAFLLVERFGYSVADVSKLFIVTCLLTALAGPRLGALIGLIGERRAIMFENTVLIAVFAGYALASQGTFGALGPWMAALFFIVDGVFFTLAIAQRTYFQKIADPADIAPTAAVAFTINHIAAVFIPVLFGLIWLRNPAIVFVLGAAIATTSLVLSFLIPRAPAPGHELNWTPRHAPVAAE